MQGSSFPLGGLASDSLVGRKPNQETPEFDITAMVDLVFMMNIYFLVTFITVALAEINLPTASHVEPLDADDAVVLTVLGSLDGKSVTVEIGGDDEGPGSAPVSDPEEQSARIAEAAERGAAAGKTSVLLKAEKKVRMGDYERISAEATRSGLQLYDAVVEAEAAP